GRTDRTAFEPHVASLASLASGGPLAPRISALGVPVADMGMRHGVADPRGILRLRAWLRATRPDVVHSWMYHANLASSLAARGARRAAPVIWAIHHTDVARTKPLTRITARISAALSSRWPAAVVVVAEAARRSHVALGFDEKRMVVIPNGFDLDTFKPDPDGRAQVRSELGLTATTPVAGVLARFDPDKDLRTFLDALGLMPDAVALLAGPGVTDDNVQLRSWLAER